MHEEYLKLNCRKTKIGKILNTLSVIIYRQQAHEKMLDTVNKQSRAD